MKLNVNFKNIRDFFLHVAAPLTSHVMSNTDISSCLQMTYFKWEILLL